MGIRTWVSLEILYSGVPTNLGKFLNPCLLWKFLLFVCLFLKDNIMECFPPVSSFKTSQIFLLVLFQNHFLIFCCYCIYVYECTCIFLNTVCLVMVCTKTKRAKQHLNKFGNSILSFSFIFILSVAIRLAGVSAACTWRVPGWQKGVSDPMEFELQIIVRYKLIQGLRPYFSASGRYDLKSV